MGHTASKDGRSFEKQRSELRVYGYSNPVFDNGKKRQLRRGRSLGNIYHPPQVQQYSEQLLKFVESNDASNLEYLLRDPPTEADDLAFRDQIVGYLSDDGLTSLHIAAKQQSADMLKALVEFCVAGSAAVNAKSEDGQQFTALHIAVRLGNLECVKRLLQHPGISKNEQDSKGCTPLHYACLHGFADIVLLLQDANFCICNNRGEFPLHLAAEEHRTTVFAALGRSETFMEKYHANSNFKGLQDSEGNTLLHLAIDGEDREIMEWCLELGFSLRYRNKDGMNSLHVAAKRGSYEIVDRLIEHVRDLENNDSVIELLNLRNNFVATPLYLASKFNHTDVMRLLLERGANIETSNTLGLTPLLTAIRYTNPQCVKLLLEKNANIRAKDKKRNFNALLWAVEVQNVGILRDILEYASQLPEDWKLIWQERDPHGNTPHHIAAKARNLNVLETLVQYNKSCLEERNNDGCTPFHIAVKEGKLPIVGYIISNAADSTRSLDSSNNTGLHLAAENGHFSIVQRLITVHDLGTSICAINIEGHTPIHLAAMNGHHAVLEFLVEHSPIDAIEILDTQNATALYLACKSGHTKSVEALLQLGAMVTYSCTTQQNAAQRKAIQDLEKVEMSCLEIAIDKDYPSVVSAILSDDKKWREALQYCHAPHCKDGETPMRKLIKKMPAAAKMAFDRCVKKEKMNDKKRGGYYFEVKYNYEFLEDFQDLYDDDDSEQTDSGPSVVIANQVASAREANFTESEISRRHTVRGEPIIPPNFHHNQPTAAPCDPKRPWGPLNFHFQNHPLHLMVEHKRQELLKHPLAASLIHYKWNLFGRYFYYPNILIYTLLMLMLTIYQFLRFDYSKRLADAIGRNLGDCENTVTLDNLLENATNATIIEETEDLIHSLDKDRVRLITLSVLIILNCVVRIVLEIGQIVHHRGEYFTSYINYLEGFLYVATIIFVSNFQLNCLPSWQWQLGAMCIFLSWINFIVFLSQQPMVGIYVVMFEDIIKTFLRMLPMSVLLVLAFGQPFFMLLSTIVLAEPPQQFVTFPYSLLKTLIMTIGEFETDPIFFSTPSVVEYPVVTYILWVIFLVVMPILLQNMLVGLAVDDIKSVQEKAALKREAIQIEFILDVISRVPKLLVRRFNKREYTQTWGKGGLDKFRKWLSGSSWKPEVKRQNERDFEFSLLQRLERMAEGMGSLEHRMLFLTEQTAKLEKMMQHFAHEQEKYLEPSRQQALGWNKEIFHSQPALHVSFRPRREELNPTEDEA